MDQDYDLQVFPSYAFLGNTAVMKCLMPAFVKEFLAVDSWMWGSETIRSNLAEDGGRYSVFADGELHVRNASSRDSTKPFRCLAKHRLTGAKTVSSISGR